MQNYVYYTNKVVGKLGIAPGIDALREAAKNEDQAPKI
jgi:hypothetical protein